MRQPLISVLMVNYNHEDFLRESIESVLNQTYQNFEFIIVDDGSTDSSADIIKSYTDTRIKPIFQKENGHICKATNKGLEYVTGEYVARIDSDDIWLPDKLEKQMMLFQNNPEAAICFTKVDIIDEKGENANSRYPDLYQLYNSRQESKEQWIRFFFFYGNSLLQSTMVFKSYLLETTGKFNLAYMQAHDFDFFRRLILKEDFYFIEESLVKYRRFEKQNSSRKQENEIRFFNEHMSIRQHFFDDFPDELFIRTFKQDFRDEYAQTPEELLCEKAFLMQKCIGGTEKNQLLGMMRLEQLLNNTVTEKILEEKYKYCPKDFYKSNSKSQYVTDDMEKFSVFDGETQSFFPLLRVESAICFDLGQGFYNDTLITQSYLLKIGKKEKHCFEINIPQGTKYINFIPCENFMCICSGIGTDMEGVKIYNVNGVRFGTEDLFLTKNPQYIIEGNFDGVEKISIIVENISVFWNEKELKAGMDQFFQEREELVKAVDYYKNVIWTELEESRERLKESRKILDDRKNEIEELREREKYRQEELEQYKSELFAIKNSRSWKMTAGLRKIGKGIKK